MNAEMFRYQVAASITSVGVFLAMWLRARTHQGDWMLPGAAVYFVLVLVGTLLYACRHGLRASPQWVRQPGSPRLSPLKRNTFIAVSLVLHCAAMTGVYFFISDYRIALPIIAMWTAMWLPLFLAKFRW